jgi:voltage-gated potassium channel
MRWDRHNEAHWRWPILLALAATVPAFYLEMLRTGPAWIAPAAYLGAAGVLAAALLHLRMRHDPGRWNSAAGLDRLLVPCLVLAATLPSSNTSTIALALRLLIALPIVVRMMLALRHLVVRGSLGYLLGLAVFVLGLCGVGFWWLEPQATSLGDGLWLAFTTAATVGYGDIVPSTHASRIFAVFVVLLGYGVLSLVTAAIAATLVESQERRIEREILEALHADVRALRAEVARLRDVREQPARAG